MDYDSKPWIKAYDDGIGPELDLPDETMLDGWDRIREQFGDRAAYHFFGYTRSFEEFFSQADQFAAALASRGFGKGDAVAVNLPNLPQYIIAQMGAARLGCPVVGISPLLSAEEMAHILRDSGAKVLLTLDPIFEHRLVPQADNLPDLQWVISTGILDFLPKFKQKMAVWLKKVPTGKVGPLPGKEVSTFMSVTKETPGELPQVEITPDDVYLLQYTGGTTGVPKGAMLTHRNLMSQVIMWKDWFHLDFGDDIACSGYPFFHAGGQCSLAVTTYLGCTQILIPNPRDTKHIVKEIKKYRPTFINNVPSLYLLLMNTPGFEKLDFSTIRFATAAAAPFPVEPMKDLDARIGGNRLVELYGLTETSPIISTNPTNGEKKIGSVGLPVPSTEVRLVDLATGDTQVPLGEKGELIVRGPQVMTGYWNNPEETDIVMREHDGRTWFHTGDIAIMDDDGYIFIVDRSKDMIIVGGFKVFPREVEEALYAHPSIEVCAVVGLDNPERPGSELVKLVVQKSEAYKDKPDDEVIAELTEFCAEHLGAYKKPKIIEIVDEVPLTAAGKVDRKVLR